MQADYSELNPKLNSGVIPLFPYPAHLHAYMRCVLFHPDYSPYISFGEQLSLAQHIVNDYKDYILTVGDIYYYVACFVEKRNPAPPGVTRSTLLNKPHKTKLKDSGFSELFTNEITPESLASTPQEIISQKIMSNLYDIFDNAAPPKGTKTIQQLWERSTQGTIHANQISRATPQISQNLEAFSDLFENEKPRIPAEKVTEPKSKTRLNFSTIFAPKADTAKNKMVPPSGNDAQIKETIITKTNMQATFRNLFKKK